ncbi:MAG: alpha-ketoacid dehydrogenase subunit beta [candidate division NC10 bacterium]|nr:alpha-ketoacid dehydrogenase subunit beta [candidate division NC10 bacterium]
MATITYREALREALREEMRRDERVFMLGEDIGIYGGCLGVTAGLIEEFGPERIRNTPISEAAIAGAAVGAAAMGMRPIAEIMYMDFSTIAMDQLVNQAAKIRYMFGGKAKIPMVLRTQGGAGRSNAAQHSQSLEAWYVHVPGLYVIQPSTPYDAKGLLKSAIRDDNPVIFIEHKMIYATKGEVPEGEVLVPIGVADVKRQGSDVTIVATSMMVLTALEAAELLAQEGIEVEVVDPRTLYPLDIEAILNSVKKTNHLVIVHEANERCGFGAEVAAQVADKGFDYLDAPIKRVCGPNSVIPYNQHLERLFIPSKERIVEAVKGILR